MTTTEWFAPPITSATESPHHALAAGENAAVADEARAELRDILSGVSPMERVLLRAAAGAGKSHILQALIVDSVGRPDCSRASVIAFTNKQLRPLAVGLGKELGRDCVCLFVSKDQCPEVPDSVQRAATVVKSAADIPDTAQVIISTAHRLGAIGERSRLLKRLGTGRNGATPFDVLFVDEAWQLPHHLFDKVKRAAPVWVGVGDVGQLPPLEVGQNPWRSDPGHNPYRAWPTDYDDDERTWSRELPAVWRPAAGHLAIWRAFYPEWGASLSCVAGEGDRGVDLGAMEEPVASIWRQVGSGVPTLLEVDGLEDAEAADVDPPLLAVVEDLLAEFFDAGAALLTQRYDVTGDPTDEVTLQAAGDAHADPLVTVLATRNRAVDDATEMVERLRARFALSESDLVSSTVDSYQGQTNGLTVAIHPLSGAGELDAFNSAFGRLAVTCTRATHGLLMVARPGLDDLLEDAPARPGTPFGEPGNRQLPRQTHQRILACFARARIDVTDSV